MGQPPRRVRVVRRFYTAAVLDDGALYTFGFVKVIRLCRCQRAQRTSPKRVEVAEWGNRRVVSVSCGGLHTAAVLDDGALYTFGRGDYGPLGHGDRESQTSPKRVEVAEWGNRRVVSVSCGGGHTAAVLDDGAYTFGKPAAHRLSWTSCTAS